ncbi:hypothetical protein NSPZN2_70060 [Nitrospira defluvii]|uniref:Uncharacterized protein n=1 Tax=Nitrospira defluvii TaxID=330214 RepID=A0ABM8S916_9BACT|nr:hypothetical protein NSPZN2_70060 [Nitrospira defluvii]
MPCLHRRLRVPGTEEASQGRFFSSSCNVDWDLPILDLVNLELAGNPFCKLLPLGEGRLTTP